MNQLKVNDIIIGRVVDALGTPKISELIDYPEYSYTLSNPKELRGIDEVELRVLDIDPEKKQVRVALHAAAKINPETSTGRIIFITYFSMRNTSLHVFRQLFS